MADNVAFCMNCLAAHGIASITSSLAAVAIGLVAAIALIVVMSFVYKHLIDRPFWRRGRMYPADHTEAVARVYRLIDLIAQNPDRPSNEIQAILLDEGLSKLDVELLSEFIPTAFTWALLRKLGVRSFPAMYMVFDKKERPVGFPLGEEHYFAAALQIAEDLTNHGFSDRVSRATFEEIIKRSAEYNALSKMLAVGHAIEVLKKSKVGPLLLMAVRAEELRAAGRRSVC